MIDWREHIEQRPDAMEGRPFCKGTRLTVQHLLERLSDGWVEDELLSSYPRLTREHIRAALAFAADNLDVERMFALSEP